jgi:hypothetical protein
LLCFALGRRLGGDAAGLAAAALYGLDPLLVVSAVLLYPEATAGLLLTGSLLAVWEALRRDHLPLVVAAALQLGGLTLFRPVGLALVPVMVGWVGLAPGRSWGRRATYGVVLIGVWVLVRLPWTYRGYQVHGRILPITTAGIGDVPMIGAERESRGVGGAVLNAAQRDPAGFARRTLRELGHFWEFYPSRLVTDRPGQRAEYSQQDSRVASAPLVRGSLRDAVSALSFGFELALAAIGLVVGWKYRRRETVWLTAVVLSFALGYALFYGKLRYRIPVLPIVLSFGGLGLAALTGRLDRTQPPDASRPTRARSQQ